MQHSGNGIPQNGFNTWQWSDNLAYMVLNIEKTTAKTKNYNKNELLALIN